MNIHCVTHAQKHSPSMPKMSVKHFIFQPYVVLWYIYILCMQVTLGNLFTVHETLEYTVNPADSST